MKLCNLSSLDPVHLKRNVAGLANASKQDREIWEAFSSDPGAIGLASEVRFREIVPDNVVEDLPDEPQFDQLDPDGANSAGRRTESQTLVMARRGQEFFRRAILTSYSGRCCITGVSTEEFLVASHIKPWSSFPENRLDPENGLCLSLLHDRAFDQGMTTFDDQYRLVISQDLKNQLRDSSIEGHFLGHEGAPICLPEKLALPSQEHLAFHRQVIFDRRNRMQHAHFSVASDRANS